MADMIDFLEALGADAHRRYCTEGELEIQMAGTDTTAALRSALLSNDRPLMESLLGATPHIFCGQHPPMDDEDEDDQGEDEPSDDEEPADVRFGTASDALRTQII